MQFHSGTVDGVIWRKLAKYHDPRGWLCELFRQDEVPPEFFPVMGYISLTEPGVARGPHEHVYQADYFCFVGPSNFKIYLWDTRLDSPSYRAYQTAVAGEDNPMMVIIPPGVVHAYKNVGTAPGWVFNCANRLYKGVGRIQSVDEIRHEEMKDHPFHLD